MIHMIGSRQEVKSEGTLTFRLESDINGVKEEMVFHPLLLGGGIKTLLPLR